MISNPTTRDIHYIIYVILHVSKNMETHTHTHTAIKQNLKVEFRTFRAVLSCVIEKYFENMYINNCLIFSFYCTVVPQFT